MFELEYESVVTRCLSAGVISSKINTLDRETKSQYVVVVRAQDMRGMASGSTATTSVTITITDTNDNMASFTRSEETKVLDVEKKPLFPFKY